MSYWVIHREQVTSEFIIEHYDDKTVAESRQRNLRQRYHDVLIVDQMDINEMFLQSRTKK
jgi:spore coat polysaccharide biosynthesis predicted glycosyltransferase SpsG